MPKLQAVMKKKNGVKTVNFYFITLPKALVETRGWTKGISLSLVLNQNGNIEIEKSGVKS